MTVVAISQPKLIACYVFLSHIALLQESVFDLLPARQKVRDIHTGRPQYSLQSAGIERFAASSAFLTFSSMVGNLFYHIYHLRTSYFTLYSVLGHGRSLTSKLTKGGGHFLQGQESSLSKVLAKHISGVCFSRVL